MKKLILIFLAFSIVWCGQKEADTQQLKNNYKKPVVSVKKNKIVKNNTQENISKNTIVIKDTKFVSKAISKKDLILDATLEKPDDKVNFEYRWFVNDREIENINTNILPKDEFKKDDWVFCKVTAIKDNLKSRTIKSKYVKILGTPPIFNPKPIQAFQVPGEFSYKIEASDPDLQDDVFLTDEEKNTLKFELISPEKEGIILNSKTGEMKWHIDNNIIKKFGNTIEIKFKISSEGGILTSSIKLNLLQQKEQTAEKQKTET